MVEDFDLIVSNCKAYNPPGNPWHDAAKRLSKQGHSRLEKWRARFPDLADYKSRDEDMKEAADADPNVMGLVVPARVTQEKVDS